MLRRQPSFRACRAWCSLAAVALSACARESPEPVASRQELLDPVACRACHPVHFDEWASSMHAYSTDDPVFLAMNRRGQRETGGALGDFCVRCHAPLAVRDGLTRDGLNLATLPAPYRGVTCTFCHAIENVEGTHNNPLVLAGTLTMLGPIADPAPTPFHRSQYSPFLDSTRTEAAAACGSCHDIVNHKGTAIERTFAEWKDTVFANVKGGLGCASCHMAGSDGPVALNGSPNRRLHNHQFAGLDVALGPWPGTDLQRRAIEEQLGTAIQPTLCLEETTNRIQVFLDNVGVGHMWPSGAGSDRRAWVEVVAYASDKVIYESGVVPPGGSIEQIDDPDLWLIRDCLFDERDREVHMFWEASRFTSNLIPTTLRPRPPPNPPARLGHLRWELPRPDSARVLAATPDRIEMRVLVRPIGDDVLTDLVSSGDLDPDVASRVPTFEVPNTRVSWSVDRVNYVLQERGSTAICVAAPGFTPGSLPAVSHARCEPTGP